MKMSDAVAVLKLVTDYNQLSYTGKSLFSIDHEFMKEAGEPIEPAPLTPSATGTYTCKPNFEADILNDQNASLRRDLRILQNRFESTRAAGERTHNRLKQVVEQRDDARAAYKVAAHARDALSGECEALKQGEGFKKLEEQLRLSNDRVESLLKVKNDVIAQRDAARTDKETMFVELSNANIVKENLQSFLDAARADLENVRVELDNAREREANKRMDLEHANNRASHTVALFNAWRKARQDSGITDLSNCPIGYPQRDWDRWTTFVTALRNMVHP